MRNNNHQNTIAEYIRDVCLYHPKNPMLGLGPGKRYKSQFYMANLTSNGDMLRCVMECFEHLLEKNEISPGDVQFCGREWSSLPILGAMAYHFQDSNTFFIRRSRKKYGRHNLIEGIPNDKPAVIVDDVCNSTISFHHCLRVLTGHDIPVHDKILCIMNKKRETDEGFGVDEFCEKEAMWIVSRNMVT